jgi:hypothetical protein
MNTANRRDEGHNLNAMCKLEVLLCNCTRCHPPNGLPCTASPSTAARLHAVLLQVCPIRMTWSRIEVHRRIPIVVRSLILVANNHCDWGSQCDSKLRARLNLDHVHLIPRRRQRTLAGSSSRHLRLDILLCELHSWRNAVNDTSYRPTVRFSIAVGLLAF